MTGAELLALVAAKTGRPLRERELILASAGLSEVAIRNHRRVLDVVAEMQASGGEIYVDVQPFGGGG